MTDGRSSGIQWSALGILAAAFLFFILLERVFPLRRRTRSFGRRLVTNALMSLTAFLAGALAVNPAAYGLMDWAAKGRAGLLRWVPLSDPAQIAIGFLLMDLSFYYWHRLNHQLPLLWRFHNVHHVDPDLDATTSFRFHFGEVLLSVAFRAVQVTALGVSPMAYFLYEITFQCETVFHHSNLRLPIRLERGLNVILVTPRMHGIHHSNVKEETNSNYSVIFSAWDRLHRSLRLNIPQPQVVIGVPAYSAPEDNAVPALLSAPFARQRDYWRLEDGAPSRRAYAAGAPHGVLLE
jgi:sterol desaturase/sphingolipid hydroxylase (fatty acid hydroxylase superfamily)